jgi:hypothetical protein
MFCAETAIKRRYEECKFSTDTNNLATAPQPQDRITDKKHQCWLERSLKFLALKTISVNTVDRKRGTMAHTNGSN